eukprot:TRINITY_DN14728_c0_g1_i5.p1 TRINITY_DN14728_c0_g1~~TRINITY_DN14728_c0_g1_i5.p1  ORF type:complete len:317 (+),score=59.03 TRINITY_DN14728_c0_g1_i5:338-1288(+)
MHARESQAGLGDATKFREQEIARAKSRVSDLAARLQSQEQACSKSAEALREAELEVERLRQQLLESGLKRKGLMEAVQKFIDSLESLPPLSLLDPGSPLLKSQKGLKDNSCLMTVLPAEYHELGPKASKKHTDHLAKDNPHLLVYKHLQTESPERAPTTAAAVARLKAQLVARAKRRGKGSRGQGSRSTSPTGAPKFSSRGARSRGRSPSPGGSPASSAESQLWRPAGRARACGEPDELYLNGPVDGRYPEERPGSKRRSVSRQTSGKTRSPSADSERHWKPGGTVRRPPSPTVFFSTTSSLADVARSALHRPGER